MILVTGGAGFIGSNFVLDWVGTNDEPVVNLDQLTYAGNLASLDSIRHDPRHTFVHGDIANRQLLSQILRAHQPRAVIHFAAESHVDRSIHAPAEFINTNIVGTFNLLEETRAFWSELPGPLKSEFRFLQVSTDEVYGSLESSEPPFVEQSPYAPNSPYAASKAAADHLVRSYRQTYGLPTLTTNCSNNYGPYQFPEKLIPLVIMNARAGKPLPIYGDGLNVRDWLYVGDHCCALRAVLAAGTPGQTYNIGGCNEMTNLEVVRALCDAVDSFTSGASHRSCRELIAFVKDRPGHDRRYAIDARKIERELGWRPAETFATGIRKTVAWYLEHQDWVASVASGAYRDWININYSSR